MSAGVGASRADHDPATASRMGQAIVREADVVVAFLQRSSGGVLGQPAVAMLDPVHLGSFFEEGKGGCRDHGVGRGRGSAGEQDRDAFDIQRMVVRHGF